MTKDEFLDFLLDNNNELILDYYNKVYDKLKYVNERIEKKSLFLIFIAFIYLISTNAHYESINIGPITIKDIKIITQILPILFSYYILEIIIISNHKAELLTTLKLMSFSIYKQNYTSENLKPISNNFITRILLPFSFSSEISKFVIGQMNILESLIGFILYLPSLLIFISPIVILVLMLRDIYINYFDTLGKISLFFSIWIISFTIFNIYVTQKNDSFNK